MISLFKNIKAVGFDLDRTLYPNSPGIDARVQGEIAQRILTLKPNLESKEKIIKIYADLYRQLGSATKVLQKLGLNNAPSLIYESLARASISDLLEPDPRLAQMLIRLAKKYKLFLITTSPSNLAAKTLSKLGINLSLFFLTVFGDNPVSPSKVDGGMFKYFLTLSPFKPNEHVYVGDSLKADILPAKALGMVTIGLGQLPEADARVTKIYEIENVLI